jgi:hypothetical protein
VRQACVSTASIAVVSMKKGVMQCATERKFDAVVVEAKVQVCVERVSALL